MSAARPALTSKPTLLVWIGLLGLILLLRVPTLSFPFENDSGAIAYHARYITRSEPLYSTHHPSHHLPGAFYLYALSFQLFGDQVASVKWVLLLWIWVTVCLIYQLGAKIGNRTIGLGAAILAAVLYSHIELSGQSARVEMFLGLGHVAAVLLLVHTLQRQGSRRNFFFIGIIGGLTFMFKATALSGFGLACIACLMAWRRQPNRPGLNLFLQRILLLGLGFLSSLLPVLLYFASLNLLPRLLMIFTLARQYIGVARPGLEGPQYLILYPLAVLAKNNFLILIAALSGLVFVLRPRSEKTELIGTTNEGVSTPYFIYIAIWFGLAFIETGTSRTYLQHYYLVFVPPLTLLAAWFLYKLYVDIQPHVQRRTAVSILVIAISAIFFLSIQQNFPFYYHFIRYAIGLEDFDTFLLEGFPDAGNIVRIERDLADYLRSHTEPSDTIYYWSNFMELYYFADRRCAIAFIWPIYAEASGEYPQIFQAKYIVIGNNTIFGLDEIPQWLPEGLHEHYVLETTIHEQAIYRRLE